MTDHNTTPLASPPGVAAVAPNRSLSGKSSNPLAKWRVAQALTYEELGELLGVTAVSASRYCRALDDPRYQQPHGAAARLLPIVTGKAVHLGLMVPMAARGAARRAVAS